MTVSFSKFSPGSVTWSVPAYATNVTFTVAAASGGGSASTTWNHSRGGFGRAGNFTIATRPYAYNLTFYQILMMLLLSVVAVVDDQSQ